MQFTEPKYPTPIGIIELIMHRDEPVLHKWADLIPDCPITDPRFGFSNIDPSEILHAQKMKNLIVNQASVFMAQRMAPGDLGVAGIGYLAVGTGFGTGTQNAPQVEDPTYKILRAEAARKAITSWTYLDAAGNPIGSPPDGVGVLQFTTTFGPSEGNFPLVEMALMGGNASLTANSGSIYNYKVFGVWNKTLALNANLTAIWTITF